MEKSAEHLVLALKYRPQKFKEVVQQQSPVRALQNAVAAQRLGSAYLFFGPRGVGKTTLARLLAKLVNCFNVQDGEPCDQCESCLSILSGNSMDVLEIDAASHRGIHHIRELRENVKFQPMLSKKKVYIIDEVHMLTSESFNALLKTLEEPPPHVMFVLATTEFNKIPETILSRCQVFTFRKVPLQLVQEYLEKLCEREGITAEEEALFWIARRGDGSLRDSLSFMEQAITYCGRNLTAAEVKELIGAVSLDLFIQLTGALLNAESPPMEILKPVHEIFNSGGDLNRFVWEFLDFLRMSIHIQQGVEDSEFLGIPQPDVQRIKQHVAKMEATQLVVLFNGVYHLLTQTYALRLHNSYETKVLIEIELLSLKEKLGRPSLAGVLNKLNKLSSAIQQGVPYSPEDEIQKRFLGTYVDPATITPSE